MCRRSRLRSNQQAEAVKGQTLQSAIKLTIVSQLLFIQNTTLALVTGICDPNPTYGKAVLFGLLEQVLPQRLVELLDAVRTEGLAFSVLTLGKPFAWAPIIVTSPGFGVELFKGT